MPYANRYTERARLHVGDDSHDVFANVTRVFETRDGRSALKGWLWCEAPQLVPPMMGALSLRATLVLPSGESERIVIWPPKWIVRDGESYSIFEFDGAENIRDDELE